MSSAYSLLYVTATPFLSFFFFPPPRLFGAHLSAFFPGSSGKTLLTGWARGSRVATISHRSGLACWSLQSHEEPLTPLFSFPTTRSVKIYLWGFIMALGQISFFPISLSSFGIVLYCPPPHPKCPQTGLISRFRWVRASTHLRSDHARGTGRARLSLESLRDEENQLTCDLSDESGKRLLFRRPLTVSPLCPGCPGSPSFPAGP